MGDGCPREIGGKLGDGWLIGRRLADGRLVANGRWVAKWEMGG